MTSQNEPLRLKELRSPGPLVVAMSGGVDSCAAAIMLKKAGIDIVGVSMQVWDYRKNTGNAARATCCSPSDFNDAREVADKFDFPFYVFDFEEAFRRDVIEPFVGSYLSGLTPNPCLECNRRVKFSELRRRAQLLKCRGVATGHYARIAIDQAGQHRLFQSRDKAKDQSYFLYALTQEELGETFFPVGDLEKSSVRAYLADNELRTAEKEESQDICFVSGTVSDFIERYTGKSGTPGTIVDRSGRKLGEHNGISHFTVGQRRGLGVGAEKRLYVLAIDSNTNSVTVGGKEELERRSFVVRNLSWVGADAPREPFHSLVKLRYRHQGVRCRVFPEAKPDETRVEFVDEWSPVSPGQAAVFYREFPHESLGYEVLGGGICE